MIYKRKTHRLQQDKTTLFEQIFQQYILPSHLKHGAILIGRWSAKNGREISEIWAYPSEDAYQEVTLRLKKDKMMRTASSLLQDVRSAGYTCEADELQLTGMYSEPRHSVAVSGYIANSEGQILLVKTYWRGDTWELPGGAVDEGETLDQALLREIYEETGVQAKLKGISGVYSNGSVVSVVFTGIYLTGELKPSAETELVEFKQIDTSNLDRYITRPKYKPRVLDAMQGKTIPYESFKVRPYQLLQRYSPD